LVAASVPAAAKAGGGNSVPLLNDDHQYSIRAYTFTESRTVPLPTALIRNLMARLEADRLRLHQTYLDTAVLAKEIDKGTGLLALLAWIEYKAFFYPPDEQPPL
jgi:hypothetical protein